jgi:hypothetical protein
VAAIKNLLVGQPEVVRRVDVQAAHQTHLDVRHPGGIIKAETLNFRHRPPLSCAGIKCTDRDTRNDRHESCISIARLDSMNKVVH